MSVRIELDNRGSVFTCLDTVTGNVVLHVEGGSQETISSITVKMEGISETRLLVKDPENDRKRTEIEIHRVLYRMQTVFPEPKILAQQSAGSSPSSASHSGYTLSQGTYTYPFKLRIPVNNYCRPIDSLFQKIRIDKGSVDLARDTTCSFKNTLPPSIFGLLGAGQGDGASVRYFLKVTVNRPQFYRANIRVSEAFVFLPIEPPRPPPSNNETYAKREHMFAIPAMMPPRKRKGFLGLGHKQQPVITGDVIEPRFTIEARLPCPPILVPREPMGLRIMVVKILPFKTPVVLRQLQLRLLVTTVVRAHEITRKIVVPLQLFHSHAEPKIGAPLPYLFGNETTPVGVLVEANRAIWSRCTIPDSISPSFIGCNISRSYELEITCGLSLGYDGRIEHVPLVMPIEVYSGIKPPPKLLERATNHPMARQQPPPSLSPPTSPHKNSFRTVKTSPPQFNLSINPPLPPRPGTSSSATSSSSPMHLRHPSSGSSVSVGIPGSPVTPTSPLSPASRRKSDVWAADKEIPPDAPPTYEDAVLLREDVDVHAGGGGPRHRSRLYPLGDGYFSGLSEVDLVRDYRRDHREGGGEMGSQ